MVFVMSGEVQYEKKLSFLAKKIYIVVVVVEANSQLKCKYWLRNEIHKIMKFYLLIRQQKDKNKLHTNYVNIKQMGHKLYPKQIFNK